MARIPYFDLTKAEGPRAKKALEGLPKLNIFRMLGHSGEMIDGFTKLGNQILNHSSLDAQLREIAIVRVGVLCKAKYEVFQHERIARQTGLSDAKIKAIHEGADASAFTDVERLVMKFTDDVVQNVRASDAVFNPALETFGPKALQELVITIGYYMLVSRFLETFDVDIEERPVNVAAGTERRDG